MSSDSWSPAEYLAEQDAIKAPFEEFLKSLPHVETKIQDDGSVAHGKLVFRLKPLPPVSERKMFIKTFVIKSRTDLWRVCHKSPSAVVEIPELEFEVGADSKRKIDSIYNHITAAVYNLSMHVSSLKGQLSEDSVEQISATVDSLNKLLDVDEPFTLKIHDRTGISEIRPEDGVETEFGGPAEEDPLETEERQHLEMLDAMAEEDEEADGGADGGGGGAGDQNKVTVTDVD
jgi:C4-type Zn-finger protein